MDCVAELHPPSLPIYLEFFSKAHERATHAKDCLDLAREAHDEGNGAYPEFWDALRKFRDAIEQNMEVRVRVAGMRQDADLDGLAYLDARGLLPRGADIDIDLERSPAGETGEHGPIRTRMGTLRCRGNGERIARALERFEAADAVDIHMGPLREVARSVANMAPRDAAAVRRLLSGCARVDVPLRPDVWQLEAAIAAEMGPRPDRTRVALRMSCDGRTWDASAWI